MAQHIFKGKMTDEKGAWLTGGVIIFPLIKDTIPVSKSDTITVDIDNPQRQVFYTIWAGWKSRIFRFEKGKNYTPFANIVVPDTVYYQRFYKKKTCPICKHKEPAIPIIYGLVGVTELGKETLRSGGCVQYSYSPKFYCKTDDFEF